MPTKLEIHNARMLALMAWAVEEKLYASGNRFLVAIGFSSTNIGNIRRGHQSFSLEHVMNACRLTGANANWIMGFETNMLRTPGKTAMQQLLEAVVAVGQELAAKDFPEQNPEQGRVRSNNTIKATKHK